MGEKTRNIDGFLLGRYIGVMMTISSAVNIKSEIHKIIALILVFSPLFVGLAHYKFFMHKISSLLCVFGTEQKLNTCCVLSASTAWFSPGSLCREHELLAWLPL